tara:strand:+ start:1255 stop:1659 length:405 start_codon:yes stop_codon:yes gene_type:complete
MTRVAVNDYPVLKDLLRAYARMWHHLDRSFLAPHLVDDMSYTSQWVFDEITDKDAFLTYIQPKLANCRKDGVRVWAEIATLPDGYPCIKMSQGVKREIMATLMIEEIKGGKIKSMEMCAIPAPESARGTGEYPV